MKEVAVTKATCTVNLKKLAIIIFAIVTFEPQYIVNLDDVFHYSLRLVYYIAILYMAIYNLSCISRIKSSWECRLFFGIFLSFIISTLLYGGIFSKTSLELIFDKLLFFVAPVYIMLQLRSNEKFILKTFIVLGEILLYINLLTIFLFPGGIWKSSVSQMPCYFLGHKNQIFEYYFLPLVCAIIYTAKYRTNIARLWLMWVVIMVSVILTASKASLIACVCLVLPMSLATIKSVRVKRTGGIYLLSGLILNFLVVILRIQDVFLGFLNISFTGRTNIWDNTMVLIRDNFLFGYGGYVGDLNGLSVFYHLISAHSGILQLMLDGGVLLFVLWLLLNLVASFRLRNMTDCRMSSILGTIFFAFYCHGIVEATYGTLTMYFLFILVCHFAKNNQSLTVRRYKRFINR